MFREELFKFTGPFVHFNRKFLFTALLALLCCVSSVSLLAEKHSQLTTVTLQLKWLHQFQFAGYYMAIENGYYEDLGINLVIQERIQGTSPIDQLLRGESDFAVGDAGSLIYHSRGVPVVALAAIFQNSPSVLVVRADKNISELADLVGHEVRSSSGYNNAELLAMYQRAGISIADLIVHENSQSLDEFISGRTVAVNAYLTNEPYKLEKLQVPIKLFQPRDYGIDFYGDILITTESLVKKSPKLIDDFVSATLRGWLDAVENPDEAINLILKKYNSQDKTTDELLFEATESIKLIRADIVPIGYMNEMRWQHVADVFHEQGLISEVVDVSNFLYQNESNSITFLSTVRLYKYEFLAITVGIIVVFLLFYNFTLRSQVKEQVKSLEESSRRAESDARTDALTDIPNRRHFLEVVGRDHNQAVRQKKALIIILCDIDYFKNINDQYGHAAGDAVLVEVGRILKSTTRGGDFFARFGGEEFTILCPDTDVSEGKKLAERIRETIENCTVIFDGKPIKLTMSFGVSLFTGKESIDDLLVNADSSMYSAKQQGRNKVVHKPF